jgi:hypothetical protein
VNKIIAIGKWKHEEHCNEFTFHERIPLATAIVFVENLLKMTNKYNGDL